MGGAKVLASSQFEGADAARQLAVLLLLYGCCAPALVWLLLMPDASARCSTAEARMDACQLSTYLHKWNCSCFFSGLLVHPVRMRATTRPCQAAGDRPDCIFSRILLESDKLDRLHPVSISVLQQGHVRLPAPAQEPLGQMMTSVGLLPYVGDVHEAPSAQCWLLRSIRPLAELCPWLYVHLLLASNHGWPAATKVEPSLYCRQGMAQQRLPEHEFREEKCKRPLSIPPPPILPQDMAEDGILNVRAGAADLKRAFFHLDMHTARERQEEALEWVAIVRCAFS